MTCGLIENTNKHNRGEAINNDLRNVSCQRRRHLCNHPNNNFCNKKEQLLLKIVMLHGKKKLLANMQRENICYNLLPIEIIHKNYYIYYLFIFIATIHHIKKLFCFH